MDNDTFKNDNAEEEYQFNETDSSGIYGEATAKPTVEASATRAGSNILERLKRRNIIIAVVVIIAVIAVYKLLDVVLSTGALHKKETPPVATISTSATTPTEMSPPINGAARNDASMVASSGVAERLNSLEQENSASQASLNRLNSQVTDMQNNLTALNNHLNDLGNAMQTLANQMLQQQRQAAAVQAAKKAALTKKVKATPLPVYFVKAMVPGRAWLVAENGTTLTLSIGDTLPGYGVVQGIDPNQGTLVMSSGAIIGYAPGDS